MNCHASRHTAVLKAAATTTTTTTTSYSRARIKNKIKKNRQRLDDSTDASAYFVHLEARRTIPPDLAGNARRRLGTPSPPPERHTGGGSTATRQQAALFATILNTVPRVGSNLGRKTPSSLLSRGVYVQRWAFLYLVAYDTSITSGPVQSAVSPAPSNGVHHRRPADHREVIKDPTSGG